MTSTLPLCARPVLCSHIRLTFDPLRQQHALLSPESIRLLNATSAAVLTLCDGQRTVAEIVEQLRGKYASVVAEDVYRLLDQLCTAHCLDLHDA